MSARSRYPRFVTVAIASALLVAITSLHPVVASTHRTVPDVSGSWSWNELVVLTAPGAAVAAFFGVVIEGPVMHVRCETWGELAIQQTGASFSGLTDQQWACVTAGGQAALTAPFPPAFAISGSISGHAVEFIADVGQGVSCSYRGSLSVAGGVATSINTTGGCDVPAPFHPNMDKSIYFNATR